MKLELRREMVSFFINLKAMKKLTYLCLGLCTFYACQNQYYCLDDYAAVEKIDAHFHIYTNNSVAIEMAARDNFKLLSINTYSAECERVHTTQSVLSREKQKHGANFAFTTTFCLEGWGEPSWTIKTKEWIEECIADGANSVKVWKNVGMEFKDQEGNILMIDDIGFTPLFNHLAEQGIPLVAHIGEPRDCWLPIDKMTTSNNRNYFSEHPEYHMYLHPELPSYQDQMSARDRMLEQHPDLIFIGCHLASLEWSIDEMAAFLDRYPNAAIDMAARMGNLFFHTVNDREKVRNFFMKYQDRLLYGTDIIEREGMSAESLHSQMQKKWLLDWEYLISDNTMHSKLIEGEFKGLHLPTTVVDKIYAQNAKKWYKAFH